MKLKVKVHVFSAFRRSAGIFDNMAMHIVLGQALKEFHSTRPISWGECSGEYNGKPEMGYIVVGMDDNEVLDMARSFEQESIMVVDGQRYARLVYCDGRPDLMLGFLVGTATEPHEGNYTYSPETGAYYYTRGVPHVAVG